MAKAMGEAGFEGIRDSVTRSHNTVAQYIATQPIMDLYEPGARVSRRWQEQACIDLDGEKKRAAEAATVSELESDSEFNADTGREKESRGASG